MLDAVLRASRVRERLAKRPHQISAFRSFHRAVGPPGRRRPSRKEKIGLRPFRARWGRGEKVEGRSDEVSDIERTDPASEERAGEGGT